MQNGLPSPENPYIFNGDFVDRGKKGLEVFLLLLSCMLAFPGGVFLNRGNHVDLIMNSRLVTHSHMIPFYEDRLIVLQQTRDMQKDRLNILFSFVR